MRICLSKLGKRYNNEWIFRNIHYEFHSGNSYAITGSNGSGKSTLLQLISGAIRHSEGQCQRVLEGKELPAEQFYQYTNICAPYLQLIEEMTLAELLNFHLTFKPFINGVDIQFFLNITGLVKAYNRQLRYYSSGMKQRVKLGLAVLTSANVVLLDEPCTNFDKAGFELYYHLIDNYTANKLLIISSNDSSEYHFCSNVINIHEFKGGKKVN